jgi:hypothetical protein
MAGVKGKSGGARPGAGRKSPDFAAYQARMRDALISCVSEEDVRAIVARAVTDAKDGNPIARLWLGAYVFGKPPEKVDVQGSVGLTITYAPQLAPGG